MIMDNNNVNTRIAKNTIALYIRMGITMIISFFATRVTLDVLGVEDYGLNSLLSSVVSLFSFINASMGTAVQRFFSVEIGKKNEENLSRVFGTGMYLHLIVAVVTVIIAEFFAIFFLHKLNIPLDRFFAAQVVIQISIISLVLTILSIPFYALLKAREEFSRIAILDIIKSVLSIAYLFILYKIDYDKLIALSLFSFGTTFLYILSLILCARKYRETKFQIIRDKEYVKKMLSFVFLLLFSVLALFANNQGIVILLNLYFGLTINAAYAIAFQVSQAIESFAMNFKQAVVPQLMQAYGANDIVRMNKLMLVGTKVTFLLMMLVSIPIFFEIDFILDIWLKEPPEYASLFTVLLIISVNIDIFSYFVYQGVHASGKIKKQQLLITSSYTFNILFLFITFKIGGSFYYAGYIPIFFSIFRNIVTIISARESINFNIKFFAKDVIIPCLLIVFILFLCFSLIVSFIDVSFYRFIMIIILNCLITTVLGYYYLLNNEERKNLVRTINLKDLFWRQKV